MFHNLKITTKYTVVIVTLALLASILTGIVAYVTTSSELRVSSHDNLKSLLVARKGALANYLSLIAEDLRFQSQNPLVLEALYNLSTSWQKQTDNPQSYFQQHYILENPFPDKRRERLDRATDGSLYSQYHFEYHPMFRALREERGYHDIFLFDAQGNLVYTVVKETDFSTNFLEGQWRETNLGKGVRKIKAEAEANEVFFFDFALYEPSNNQPASFVAHPLRGENDQFVGVLAFQLPVDRLNSLILSSVGMGKTGEVIVIGDDLLRRSNSRFTSDQLVLQERVESDVVRSALQGQQGVMSYENSDGENVFAAFDFVDFQNVRWALIAEIEEGEILAPIQRMK